MADPRKLILDVFWEAVSIWEGETVCIENLLSCRCVRVRVSISMKMNVSMSANVSVRVSVN